MDSSEFGDFFGQMPPLLIFNICMVLTLISGLLIYFSVVRPMIVSRRRKAHDRAQPAAMPDVDSLTSATASIRRTGAYTVLLNDGEAANAVEVLAILRDTADNRLIIQLDDTGYRTLVDHPQIKTRFTALMKELAETIAKADTPRAEMPQRPVVTPASVVESPIETPDIQAYPDDFDLPDLDSLSTLPAAPPPPAPASKPAAPKRQPTNGGTPVPGAALPNYRDQSEPTITKQGIFRPPKVEFAPIPELNLASAIEAYLQHRLYATQEFPEREIHVHSAPGGGVRIQVDEMYYDAVGDIDEPAIRGFIAETIEEWQDQQ